MSKKEFYCGLHSDLPPENWRNLSAFDLWKTDGMPEKTVACSWHRIAGDFIDPRLAQLAPGENFRLRMDFLRMLEQSLRRAVELGMEAVTVSCDWERLLQDALYRENWLAQMRFAAGVLHGLPLKMGLRFRLAQRDETLSFCAISKILKEIPNRSILLALEFYPHESSTLPDEKKWMTFCREALLLEFGYEPMIGNQLTRKLIEPGLSAASAAGIPLVFHPRKASGDSLAAECNFLQQILSAGD